MSLEPGLRKVADAFYDTLNTPTSLSCKILLRYGEWGQLATKQVDPRNYIEGPWGAAKYFRDSQACNFLRKSPLLPGLTPKSRRLQAEVTFDECEKQCKTTNEFLELLKLRSLSTVKRPEIETRLVSILDRARQICSRILGPLPDDYEGRFGPGTSFELKGHVHSTFADKLWITPTATSSCMPIFEHDFWRTLWGRRRLELGLPLPGTTRGNRFTTVPKDATKDRGICVEPLGNLWVQLGIGSELKRRLKRVGLQVGITNQSGDPFNLLRRVLPDGQDFHRQRAREGSLDGSWATIDLSNASDTVALELVRWVIPPDWFDLLYAVRSPFTLFNKKWIKLEKFSSMGNGYTFELESLIFAALVAAASGLRVGTDVFSYGDDILVPGEHADTAMAVLQACGFTPNARKSFSSGPFRESCGGDYFSGFNVRSCYADSKFETPIDWIVLHNQLRCRGASGPTLHRCVQQIPSRLRKFGPRWLGDRVLHGPFKPRANRRGYLVLATVCPTVRKVPLDRWGWEFASTLGVLGAVRNGRSGIRPSLTPRGSPDGFRIRLASVS